MAINDFIKITHNRQWRTVDKQSGIAHHYYKRDPLYETGKRYWGVAAVHRLRRYSIMKLDTLTTIVKCMWAIGVVLIFLSCGNVGETVGWCGFALVISGLLVGVGGTYLIEQSEKKKAGTTTKPSTEPAKGS
jgi:hypothetical protein